MGKILVIKHGALGDVIQATEAFRTIKEAHKNDIIVAMTRKPFVDFIKKMSFFNEVIIDSYPKISIVNYYKTLSLIASFDKVYDLQHSRRTKRYFKLLNLFGKLPITSTIPVKINRDISAFDIFREQLKIENINNYGTVPYLDFMKENIEHFNLPANFALIVAGCSARGIHKQWTPEGFAEVTEYLILKNITPVFVGTDHDLEIINKIIKLIKKPDFINLCSKTNLNQLASIARKAKLALTVDTGPAHIIGGVGCKTFIMFNNKYTNAKKSLAIGKSVIGLEYSNLLTVSADQIIERLKIVV